MTSRGCVWSASQQVEALQGPGPVCASVRFPGGVKSPLLWHRGASSHLVPVLPGTPTREGELQEGRRRASQGHPGKAGGGI